VRDLRPESVLAAALTWASGEESEKEMALAALRYAGNYLPPEEFAPTAIKVAAMMPPAEGIDEFILAHRLVAEARHPDLSPQAALRLADVLVTATSYNLDVEQQWRDTAKELYQYIVDSGHPAYAGIAAEQLASRTFKATLEKRLEEWETPSWPVSPLGY
jgi:hypothetical protein